MTGKMFKSQLGFDSGLGPIAAVGTGFGLLIGGGTVLIAALPLAGLGVELFGLGDLDAGRIKERSGGR